MLYRIFTPTIDKEPEYKCFTEFSPQLLTKNLKKEELEIPVLRNYWSHLSDSNGRPTDSYYYNFHYHLKSVCSLDFLFTLAILKP